MTDQVPKTPARWGKIPDLAAAGGFSERYARKLRQIGRLVVGQGGLIDVPASLRLIAACRDPGRGGKRGPYRPSAPPAASPPPWEVPEAGQAAAVAPRPLRSPCLLAQEGCQGLNPALSDSCKGWDAADLVLTGFQLGWLAAGPPDALESFLRHRDPDLALYESLQGHLATVLIRVIGPIDAPVAESRELAPDNFAEDRT